MHGCCLHVTHRLLFCWKFWCYRTIWCSYLSCLSLFLSKRWNTLCSEEVKRPGTTVAALQLIGIADQMLWWLKKISGRVCGSQRRSTASINQDYSFNFALHLLLTLFCLGARGLLRRFCFEESTFVKQVFTFINFIGFIPMDREQRYFIQSEWWPVSHGYLKGHCHAILPSL